MDNKIDIQKFIANAMDHSNLKTLFQNSVFISNVFTYICPKN